MSALSWDTKTVVASGSIGSYGNDGDDYTFRIYATAERNGRNATLTLEYTVKCNNTYAGYSQYSGPYMEFYVDTNDVRRAAEQIDHLDRYEADGETFKETSLATYTKTLTADSLGHFSNTWAKGVWTRNGTTGWAPKDITINNDAIEIADIEALGLNVKVNNAWKHALCYVKVDGEWKQGLVYVKNNGTWKAGQ